MRQIVSRLIVFGLLILGLSGLTVVAQSGLDTLHEDLQAKTILIDRAEVADALRQVERGTLVQLSPRDFQALQSLDAKPDRLHSKGSVARYRARFVAEANGEANLSGTAEWMIRRPAESSAVIALEGLQIAVRQAKWSDGLDAILYKRLPDSHTRLYVPEGPERSLNLEWSTRGINEPGEIRFDLGVPSFPIATFELDLPVGLTPVLPQAEAVLTGPFPAAAGEHAWRITLGGITRLEILLRRASETSPSLFARLSSIQNLNASETNQRFEFQVESAKTGFSELQFGHDPSFIPSSVTANNLVSWSSETVDTANPSILIRLREPTRSASVVISGTSAIRWNPDEWRSPSVWLKNAILRSEKLTLSVGPSLELRDARFRDFTLVKSGLAGDRSYEMELEPALLTGASRPERPSVVVSRSGQGAWKVSQQAEWTVGRNEERLVVSTSVVSASNAPRSIRFGIPRGWIVDRVERSNREAIWAITGPGKGILEAELGSVAKKGELVAYLRRLRPDTSRETLDLPDLFPEGCSSRSGSLKIQVDPSIDAALSDPIPDLPAAPQASMTREISSIPLTGQLYLSHNPALHHVSIENMLQPTRAGHSIASEMRVAIESGAVSELSLWTPALVDGDWEWRDGAGNWLGRAVRSPVDDAVTSLLGLACQPALPALTSHNGLSLGGGYRWRLKFARPLLRDTLLQSVFSSSPGKSRHPLPIPWPVSVRFSGIIRSSSELTPAQRDLAWTESSASAVGEYEYLYGERSSLPHSSSPSNREPEFRDARVIHSIDDRGDCRVSFGFFVRRWTSENLPLTLPEDASTPEVLIAGRPTQSEVFDSSSRLLKLSVPRSDLWTSVELRYRISLRQGFFSIELPRLTPEGPFDPGSVRGFWQISPKWRPLLPTSWQAIPGTGERRQSLPVPDFRAFVDRSQHVPVNWKSGRVVVDKVALSQAGPLSLESLAAKVGAAPLDSKRVVTAECAGGVLVTTSETLDGWRFESGWLSSWPKDVEQAVSEALHAGFDGSGRFISLGQWDSKTDNLDDPFDAAAGWSVFEDEGLASDSLRLLHSDRITGGTWFFSLLLTGGILLLSRRKLGYALLVVALAASCSVWFIFPVLRYEVAGPAIFVFVGGILFNFVRPATTIGDVARRSNVQQRALASIVALVLLTTSGIGADTKTTQVSEIRDRDGRATSYLVPTPIFDRAREANGLTPYSPVIISASYSASRVGTTASLRATYRLHNFEERTGRVMIPIAGARFRSVSLDGAEARDIEAGPDGIRVAVGGKGIHTLELQFTIGIGSTGNERELKFAIPEVPISHLSFDILGSASPLQLGGWRGAVSVEPTPGGQRLKADLGSSSALSVRWSEETGSISTVRVKQASVWQLTPQSGTLSGLFEYRISRGGVGTFQIAIPGNSEVSRLGIRADSTSLTTTSARIRDWSVGPVDGSGERKLTIQTLTPITNRIIFSLELALATPIREKLSLQFPRPLGITEVEAYLATGLVGLEERVPPTTSGLAVAPIETVVRDVWASLDGSPYTGHVTAAYRTDGKSPPRLNLALGNKASSWTVNESVVWWIEPTRLLAKAETRWKGNGISTIEWTVPADVSVLDVAGKGVVSWSQEPGKVRVWLDSPVNEISLNWQAVRSQPVTEISRVTIPEIVHLRATEIAIQTRARSVNGWLLSPSERALPGTPLSSTAAGELAWSTNRPGSVKLRMYPPQVGDGLPIRTTLKLSDDRIQSVGFIQLEGLNRKMPHLVTVQLLNCADCTAELVYPPLWKVSEAIPKSAERRWEIAIPAEESGPRSLKMVVSPRDQNRSSWTLPRVTVRTAGELLSTPNQVIHIDSNTLSFQSIAGLKRLSPTEWQAVDRDWKGSVVRRVERFRDEVVQFSRREILVQRVGQSWVYHGTFAILSSQSGLIRITAPAGATRFSCETNGRSTKLEPSSTTFSVEAASAQLITLTWSSAEPHWHGPQFYIDTKHVIIPEIDWRVSVPLGWNLELPAELLPGQPNSRASRNESSFDSESRLPGSWHEFRASEFSNSEPRLTPRRSAESIWPMVIAGSLLLGVMLLGWLARTKSTLVRASMLAFLAAFLLGPSAGVFLVVPVGVVTLLLGRLLKRLVHRTQPRDLAIATS